MAKICFFLKLNLWELEKNFQDFFWVLESQDKIETEHIYRLIW